MFADSGFGGLFRSRRKALSLTLREFCRRNGLDVAHISRLERSLVPPPRDSGILAAYAKALKLEEGTADWEHFFTLAAAETGRVPDVIPEENKQRLSSMFLQLRAEAHGQIAWVKARHLEDWAGTLDARATLPELLRRLVATPGKDIKHADFNAQEQTHRPGWDGIVEAESGDAFVPVGISVWEMGVDKNFRKKYDDDLRKRTKSTAEADRKKTTFIFVTPRKWQKKLQALKDNTDVAGWKKVRIYDSSALEQWLEQSPAVDMWLAERLGLKPEGVSSVDDYWGNLQAATEPSLNPEVYLASREKQVKELESWVRGPAGAIAIESRSPAEAVDFVAAFSRDPARRHLFDSRAMIVEDRNAWRRLAASPGGGLLLVPHPSLPIEPELVAQAVKNGNKVLVPTSQAQREGVSTIRLTRTYRADLATTLVSSGLEHPRAEKLARDAGGSITVLKRLLVRFPGTAEPAWSKPREAVDLVPLLLAGSWLEDCDGDRAAVERIANRPYGTVADVAARWFREPDSPVRRIGSRWSLVSRDDSWLFIASSIQADDLHRFEAVALDVLGEDDPSLELPPDKRWEASFRRKGPKFSPALRNGLAETLALLGSRSDQPEVNRSEQMVRKLLDGAGWLRWASLSDQLPLLAEAGPKAFLKAVEHDLQQASGALTKLFEERVDPWFGGMPHTGVLWGLESLSWNSELLLRVALVLADLVGKKLPPQAGNTPFRSLSEIFMSWFPQTCASVEERLAILRKLVDKRPDVGWRLLLAMLPDGAAMATDIHRPSWRDWALGWSPGVKAVDYWRQVTECALLLVQEMGDDAGRWKTLIKHVQLLPEAACRRFIVSLDERAGMVTDETVRRDIADAIREAVSLHRRFSSANWALPEALVSELEQVQRRFEPKDSVQRIAWLFGPHWQALERVDNQEERLKALRREAIEALLDQEGWNGVLRLSAAVTSPGDVGATLAAMPLEGMDAKIVPGMLASADEKAGMFARGFAWTRLREQGWNWAERLNVQRWPKEEIGRLLLLLDFGREAWGIAGQMGPEVAAWYWEHTGTYLIGKDLDESTYAIRKFLEYKRPSAAFPQIRMALHQKQAVPPELLLDVLEAWLECEMPGWTAQQIHNIKFDIDSIFATLQKAAIAERPGFEIKRLADLEWRCLALLDGYPSSPVILHRILGDEAEFFVRVLALCFRGKDAPPKAADEFTDREKQAAQNAYRLLMSWETVPGSRDDGTVDEERLQAWTNLARELAEPLGLLEICDSKIGQVLAHADYEPDQTWPCIAVRDALEDIGSEEVFDGFQVGIFNKRGTVVKSPREGGAQERALAEDYRKYAEACRIEWPKTAAALLEMAAQYEEYAKREDLSAEFE